MKIIKISIIAGILFLSSNHRINAQEAILDQYYSGNYHQVITQTDMAISGGDTALNTFYLKALSEAQLGRLQSAIHTLEDAWLLFPDENRIKRMLAGQYDEAGDFVKAKSLYLQLVESDSSDVASMLKLAEIASFTQQYNEAVPMLERILVQDSTNLNSLMMLGEIFTRQNNSGAIVYYEKAYEIYPNNQKVSYALGNWYVQEKMPDKAVPICFQVLEKDSTSIKFQKLIGFSYYKMGEPASGIPHFRQAAELGDSTVFTFKFMGISQYMIANFNIAIESLQIAVEKDTMDAEIHFFLGASLGTTTQKEKALYHLEQSLKLMKPDPAVTSRIYSEQGNLNRLEMEYEKAYELYSLAWETDTTNLMSLYFMASILDNSMHRSKEALVDYMKFIDQADRLNERERRESQIPSVRTIVEERIIMLKEELFFLDEQ